MAPTESQRWRIKEYLRAQLESINQGDDYWNNVQRVVLGHLSTEEIQGATDSPFFSIQDDDGATDATQRTFNLDSAELIVGIKGYKKTDYVGEDLKWEAEREAERLLKDAWRAIMQNMGMNCDANKVEVSTPTRVAPIAGLPGWVECIITLIVGYQNPYNDP